MSDDHEDRGSGEGADEGGDDGAAGAVGDVAGGTHDVVGGVADLLGDGEDTADAREGLETAGEIAEGVEKGAETAGDLLEAGQAIGRGDVGDAAGGLGGALGNAGAGVGALTGAIGNMVPEEVRRGLREASRVASAVGQVARGVGQIVEGGAEFLEELTEHRTEVEFHLFLEGEDIAWTVFSVHFEDAIGRLTEATVNVRCPHDAAIDEEHLLSRDVHLNLERGDEARSLRGIVKHAQVFHLRDHTEVRLEIVPALWLLSQTLDSRVYQDLTVPALVERVVSELLGSRHRSVRSELTQDYQPHDYLVQYRESHFHFLSRLCDEEGIFFYFDHDGGDHEILVLADSNDNRPVLREAHGGRIEYEENENRQAGREVAYDAVRTRRVGPTDTTVRGFDWTNPSLNVQHERTQRGPWNGPPLEVYDHHHAVRHHEYDDGGGQYRSHTAERRSRIHSERLDLARQSWTVYTTVVAARPGHVFELAGTDDHDGRYLIVSVNATGSAGNHGGAIDNTLEVIPVEMPYRPPVPVRPVMPGPETAVVVGPPGEEIHTDRHGRIKVQFHWDRQGQRNEHSSAWIRVTQSWAGPGWGFVFIPRIGMEVIVSFLGGDPDRPIVTGCVYNGTNTPPYPLPQEKTKSTIKTNSSLGGGGSNELRFEDKAGSEEVYIHAQKDFNEVVEHNHSTHVKNCQTNTVDVDQTERVKRDQTLDVERDRTKTVQGTEVTTVMGERHEVVNQNEFITVDLDRSREVNGHDKLKVKKNRNTTIDGQYNIKVTKHYKLEQNAINELYIDDCLFAAVVGRVQLKAGDGVHYDANPDGLLKVKATGKIQIEADDNIEEKSQNNIKLRAAQKIAAQADTEITLMVGPSLMKISASGIEISGPSIKINATSGTTEIDAASQVKIKC